MANRETAQAAQTSEGVQVQPTAVEIRIGKALARVSQMKHVDVKSFITDYFFPLIGAVAKEQGDQGERLDDVEARLGQLEGSAFIEQFEDTRDIIMRLADFADEIMVASGFYVVVPGKGLQATDKIPPSLREKYEKLGEDAKEVVLDIVDTIADLKAQGEQDDGDPDPEPDDDEEKANEVAAGAIADAAADVNANANGKTEGGSNAT